MARETPIADEVELVARAQAGEAAAFDALWARHREAVAALGRRWFGDGWLAEEVVQETRLLAWQHLGELRRPDRLSPWLLRIARRHASHRARSQAVAVDSLPDELPVPWLVPPTDDTVLSALYVEQLLARLAPDQRQVVELCLVDGLSLAEAATRLGLAPGQAKGRLQRARATLRREMGSCEANEHDR